MKTFRALHGPMGLLAQQDALNAWDWPLTDGLGSIRAVLDDAGNPLHVMHYAPYGEPFGATGTPQLPHGFTGEPTDANGLVYLRARYYVPGLGVFPSLDPVEDGNRYGYVAGNVVNKTDPLGLCALAEPWCPKALQDAGVTLSAIGTTLTGASGAIILTGGAVVVGGAIVYILFSTPPRPLSPEEISQLIAYELNSIPPTNETERIRVAALVYAKYGMTVMAQPQTDAPAIPIPKVYPDTTVPGNVDVWRDTMPEWQAADLSPTPQPGPFAPPSPATPTPCSTPTPTPTKPPCDSDVFRVQGGTGDKMSWEFIAIGPNGGLQVRRELMIMAKTSRVYVTFDNPDRALDFLINKRPGGYIVGFKISSSFVAAVRGAARREEDRSSTDPGIWAQSPVIGDPRQSNLGKGVYTSFGLPEPWLTGLEQSACPGTGYTIP